MICSYNNLLRSYVSAVILIVDYNQSTNDEDDEEDIDDDSPIAIVGFVHFGVDSVCPPLIIIDAQVTNLSL